uniref:Sphingomyelin synthase-like domain-containing protein n=1 Tax=Strigamia maritima TaxID=126957 RepID=T1IPF2_STRMM
MTTISLAIVHERLPDRTKTSPLPDIVFDLIQPVDWALVVSEILIIIGLLYTPRRCYLLHWLSWLLSLTGVIMVLISRGHYTVDVIIAYYVTTRLFWIYHTIANNSTLKMTGPNNYLARVWWFTMFQYFEANVNGIVPRQYEWPLSWPRRFFSRHQRDS